MSAPLRFLGLAIVSYVALRTAASALSLDPVSTAVYRPIQPPLLDQAPMPLAAHAVAPPYAAPPPPPGPMAYGYPPGAYPYPVPAYAPMPYPVPAFMPAPYRTGSRSPALLPSREAVEEPAPLPASYGETTSLPPLSEWPAIGTAGPFSAPVMQTTPSWGEGERDGPIAAARQRRWSLDAWALMRPPREGLYPVDDPALGLNPGLAPAGSLGGSQAGLRLTFRPFPGAAVHMRASTALMPQGRRNQTMAGGEGAVGISYQPVRAVPVRLMAERRQRLGPALGGGRDAFAFLAEGGISDRPLGGGILLDGYAQGGLVGLSKRDLFADGALVASYPFMPRLSFGGGVWGGAQPGLSRLDAGPRLSYQLHPRLRLHLDYRFRATGKAEPATGPALTVAGGF